MAPESRKYHHSTQNQKLHQTVFSDFFRKKLTFPLCFHFTNKNPDRGIKSDLKRSLIFLFFENLLEISLVIFFLRNGDFYFRDLAYYHII